MEKLVGPLSPDFKVKRAAVQILTDPAPGNLEGWNGVFLRSKYTRQRYIYLEDEKRC